MVGAALIGWIAGEVMAGDGRRDVVGADGKLVETIEPGTIAAWLDAHLPRCRACRRHRRRPVRRRARPPLGAPQGTPAQPGLIAGGE